MGEASEKYKLSFYWILILTGVIIIVNLFAASAKIRGNEDVWQPFIIPPPDYGQTIYSLNASLPENGRVLETPPIPPAVVKRSQLNSARLNYLATACAKYRDELHYHHHRLIVDSWHSLLYCEISKGGCSTIKAVWMELNSSKDKNIVGIDSKHVKYTAVTSHHLTKKLGLSLKTSNEWPKGYQNYTKFIVVRHPMARLVSAYYNLVKFRPGMADHGSNIVSHFQKKLNIKQLTPQTLPFDKFLADITDKTSSIYKDRHFSPISDTCSICTVKYDYFMRLETLGDDYQPVAKILGHPQFEISTYGALNGRKKEQETSSNELWSKYLPEYHDITTELFARVLKRYKYDLNLFGYFFNLTSCMATCSISENGKERLC